MKYIPISNSVLIIDIQQMKNITYLEEKDLDRYISTKKTLKKRKKYNLWEKPFEKDNFDYDAEIETNICPLGEILYRWQIYEHKKEYTEINKKND